MPMTMIYITIPRQYKGKHLINNEKRETLGMRDGVT